MGRSVRFLPGPLSIRMFAIWVASAGLVLAQLGGVAGEPATVRAPLIVDADFEGGSIAGVEIDQEHRVIRFMPGGDPLRGWPCWWYFRIDGIVPGEHVTLRLRASTATVADPTSPLHRPLSETWAMPSRASYSTDGKTWRLTEAGAKEGEWMVYRLRAEGDSCFVAWGAPFTPSMSQTMVNRLAEQSPFAEAQELCRSREGRAVPMLVVREGDRPRSERKGVWVQARQHAWESGSSWVARGFAEWLTSDDEQAAWLRQHAEIHIVPVMDIDNTATGNGGKDAAPHDHNRDWSDKPHWNEVAAAQKVLRQWVEEGRMDLFLDIHNPGRDDATFFYALDPTLLSAEKVARRDRFIAGMCDEIERMEAKVPLHRAPKNTGPHYHPLWRHMATTSINLNSNPQTVSLCLEAGWSHENATPETYRAMGAALGKTVARQLRDAPPREDDSAG